MTQLAFGSWPSPILAATVAAGGTGVGNAVGHRSELWWSELRPSEGGRAVLVSRSSSGAAVDRLPAPFSARTRVHEYGGGAWWPGADGVYFANWSDQRLYHLPTGEVGEGQDLEPVAVTAEPLINAGWRYADGREHPDGDWIVCVREDHHNIGVGDKAEAANEIVAMSVGTGVEAGETEQVVLVTGPDFVSAPRISSDGRWLSWVQWDHPNMPWDGTSLCAAPIFANMRIGNVQTVSAGGTPGIESIHGADWTADGRLVFSSDRNGYWNLYAWTPGSGDAVALTALEDAEIGAPAWNFGTQRWTELDDGRLAVVVTRAAKDSLGLVESAPSSDGPEPVRMLATPDHSEIGGLHAFGGTQVVYVGSGGSSLATIVVFDAADMTAGDGARSRIARQPDDLGVSAEWFSRAESVTFDSGGRQAHCFFYPPTGPELEGLPGELPPLIVMGHGGPTAHSGPGLSAKIQFWTSRGFAVVDVNYGGSSGFGRAYRDLLQGAWGIVDVEDCINAAVHLAETGRVDGSRLTIRGGSAGGFTVLTALIESDLFAAGTSLYGVADLTALAADTHKFESRYLDGMIGPYPERRDLYEQRSPINRTEGLSSPLLVLQGTEDEIVPPNQSEAIVAALAAKGVPHAYVAFEGEQHGFRIGENIIRSLEVELWFYGRILGIEPSDQIEPPAGAVGLS